MAVRIAQRIGMHRDGTQLSLSPFESEMRRRIWWQCVVLDSHASQISGSAPGLSSETWDSMLPANVNDDQMWPEMTEPPVEQEGATEMFFCMIRFEFGRIFQTSAYPMFGAERIFDTPTHLQHLEISERDKLVDEAEQRISDRWLKHADPFRDLHVLAMGVVRTAFASIRLLVHHPRQYPDGGASMSQRERDLLFANALKIMEYDHHAHISQNLRKFRWHVAAFFQLYAFVYVLTSLCSRTSGAQVDAAWALTDDVFHHHPDLLDGSKRTVSIALTNLTLRAWSAYEGRNIKHFAFIDKIMARKPLLGYKSKSADSEPAQAGRSDVQRLSPAASQALSPQQQQQQQQQQRPPLFSHPSPAAPSQFTIATPQTLSPGPPSEFSTPQSGFPASAAMYPSDNGGKLFKSFAPTTSFPGMDVSAAPAQDMLGVQIEDPAPMDWVAWDSLIKDSELEGFEDSTNTFTFDA